MRFMTGDQLEEYARGVASLVLQGFPKYEKAGQVPAEWREAAHAVMSRPSFRLFLSLGMVWALHEDADATAAGGAFAGFLDKWIAINLARRTEIN